MRNSAGNRRLSNCVSQNITVNLKNSEPLSGVLSAVQADHIVILDENGSFVYCQTPHVKSVSATAADRHIPFLARPGYIKETTFENVLRRLVNRKVKIDREGSENIEGVLKSVSKNNAAIAAQNDLYIIPVHRIKSVSRISSLYDRGGEDSPSGNRLSGRHESSGSGQSGRGSHRSKRSGRSSCSNGVNAREKASKPYFNPQIGSLRRCF